jgi:hypothetical protein
MHPFFTELGRSVGARWKQQNFSPAAFPKIACELLEAKRPSDHVELAELIRDFLLNDEQAFQTGSGFGQPELVVYDEPRFYIQILFWLEGTTDIHQHTFSGAFHVLAGSSIHSHFEFTNARSISAHLRVGDIRMKDTRLLETGSTVPIHSGTGFIHSLFHLEMPSLTVVVRTHTDPGTGPQFTYLPPHIAVDPFHNDALTTRRKQLLDVLERTAGPSYVELISEMVYALDFERGFFVLQNGAAYLRSIGAWDGVLELFEKKRGKLARFVAPTLDEIIRRDTLVEMRGTLTDSEHRFFLALLMNVPSGADILQLIATRFPGDPIEHVLRWAEELTSMTDQGTWMLDAAFPDGVAVGEEEQGEAFVAALRKLLQPKARSRTARISAPDLKRFRAVLQNSSLRALVP